MSVAKAAAESRLPWNPVNPYPFYERCRAEGDVVWDDTAQFWLVVGYHAARQVLGEPGWTSDPRANPNNRAVIDQLGGNLVDRSMLLTEGASHRRLRGAVRDVFTPGFIAGLSDGVQAVTESVVNFRTTGTPFDFMTDIALLLPLTVAAEWFGLDAGNAECLRSESPAIVRMLGALANPAEINNGAAAFATLIAEFLPLAAHRRVHPGDDLLSLIAADTAFDLDDVVITAILIAVAGHETTANLLGAAMVRLLQPSDACCRLIDNLDPVEPSLLGELLRLDAPVQATARMALQHHSIGDVVVDARDQVLVVIAAANRDPAVFENPGHLRLQRQSPPPLTFGYGAHCCLGAAFARLEICEALRQILARGPELTAPATWRDTPAIRGPLTVPMVFNS